MKIAIIGRTNALYETARYLRDAGHEVVGIVTAKEAPEYSRSAEDFRDLAKAWGIPFKQTAQVAEHAKVLASMQADIAVSANYITILPQSIVDMFPLGILNAHGGDLPRYRGNACQAWAILNGEQRIGLCIHRMNGGELDSGDIIARDYFASNERTKITEVLSWMARRTPELMLEAVSQLAINRSYVLEVQSKDAAAALRCYPRRPEDARIDWRASALDVLRLINASNRPFGGAFGEFDDQRITVWDAELVIDGEIFFAVPGQVTRIGEGFVEVACGSGKLRLLEVEVAGSVCTPNLVIRSIRTRLH